MPTAKTTIAILLASIVLLGPLIDSANSFDLDKVGECAEIASVGGSAGLKAATPIFKKLTKCVGFKPTKTQGLKRADIFLLISSFIQKAISNPLCMTNLLVEGQKVISPHVDKLVAKKCF